MNKFSAKQLYPLFHVIAIVVSFSRIKSQLKHENKMKRFINSIGIGLMVAFFMLSAKPSNAQPRMGLSINFQTFYDELSPYGDWIDYPEYGYTWRPRLGSDFRPYSTNGNWVYADDSWMWNSDYDWGWAPFHYGRWFNDPFYGWLWVPGYDWSPAWVSWRGGGDYYGWAPIRPGISISIGFGNYNPPYDYWTFAPCRYMTSPFISRYYHPFRNNINIFNRTTIINNYYGGGRNNRYDRDNYYRNGPRRTDVERYTGHIRSVSVRNTDRAGRATVSRNSVSVYRPTVSRSEGRTNYSPRNVESYDRNSVARNTSRSTRSADISSDSRINNNTTRITDGRSRNTEATQPRSTEMKQRNTEENQRSIESRQRNVAENQRSVEMRQRNEAEQQRSVEMRQRNAAEQQRSVEMRQRNAAEQQRSMEMKRQNEVRVQQENRERVETQQRSAQVQREYQSRSREVQQPRQQYTPRVESRSEGRSFEGRSSSQPPSRIMSSNGGDRGGRGGGRGR